MIINQIRTIQTFPFHKGRILMYQPPAPAFPKDNAVNTDT